MTLSVAGGDGYLPGLVSMVEAARATLADFLAAQEHGLESFQQLNSLTLALGRATGYLEAIRDLDPLPATGWAEIQARLLLADLERVHSGSARPGP